MAQDLLFLGGLRAPLSESMQAYTCMRPVPFLSDGYSEKEVFAWMERLASC